MGWVFLSLALGLIWFGISVLGVWFYIDNKQNKYWLKNGGYKRDDQIYCPKYKADITGNPCAECLYYKKCNGFKVQQKVCIFICIILSIAICIGCWFLFANSDNMQAKGEIESYVVQKQTIEKSIKNENLSGLERLELVKQTNELNSRLAKEKIRQQKWSTFQYSKQIKQQIAELEYINLGE